MANQKAERASQSKSLKIGFCSLGCPKNLVDSEVMMGQVVARGHQLTNDPREADVIVINTCSFIEPAQQESVNTILEMARYKQQGRLKRLIVAGCLVERYRQEIQQHIPEVDALIGTNEIEKVVDACEGVQTLQNEPISPYLYQETTPRVLATPRHFAYVKIAEGCDHPCSFCIIPKLRGSFRSRRPSSVIAEVQQLLQRGVREIILVGQDTTSYGQDLGIRDGLALLLKELALLPSPQKKWIRFLYAYPNKVTPRLLETIAEYDDLVKYIDLPLQHASASVLKRMKRGGNGELFLRLLEKIRSTIPGVTIRTTFIVGFPGETERDFEELCQFVEAAQFDRLGVFQYSDEETAGSYHLDGKVDRRTSYNRKRKLLAIQRKISRRRLKQLVGQTVEVLVDGVSPESELLFEARLPGQAPEIDGVCYVNEYEGAVPRAGEFRRLLVTEAHDYDLVGKLLAEDEKLQNEPISRPEPFVILNAPRVPSCSSANSCTCS